jgi:Helicase conserved C-terminal domain
MAGPTGACQVTPSNPFVGLKGFQRASAAHVDRMLFDEGCSRYLVADEAGLGKTLVARGVVARALERFAAEGVERVDVVYISSNAEIGRQNVRRLVPPGYDVFDRLDRLTLLPIHVKDLEGRDRPNFISFTPGTMPDSGFRTGWSRERALIYVLLARAWDLRLGKGTIRLLMHPVRDEDRFRAEVKEVKAKDPDRAVGARFVKLVEGDEGRLRKEFEDLSQVLARGTDVPSLRERRLHLVARLRLLLARACVAALEPDLVILDEFQRFRHLLDDESDAALLFRAICEYADEATQRSTKVLLLSATPYRMYTTREEDDDHYGDFGRTLRFLMDGSDERAGEAAALLEAYRTEMLRADDATALIRARDELAKTLRTVMVRTERLGVKADRSGMLDPHPRRAATLEPEDVQAYLELDGALRDAGERPGAVGVEYWKSAPYLPNLMDKYQLKKRLHAAAKTRPTARALARRWRSGAGLLPFDAIRDYQAVPATNPRLRTLEHELLDGGLWRTLWIPPALPYYELGDAFANCTDLTKRLIFSAWRVAPRAIAALTSYEAERRMIAATEPSAINGAESRVKLDRRLLDFKVAVGKSGRRTGMPVLGLMYPSISLAGIDPLDLRRERARNGQDVPTLEEARKWAKRRVTELLDALPASKEGPVDERWFWAAPILLDGEAGADWLGRWGLAQRWAEGGGLRWPEHVLVARNAALSGLDGGLGRRPDDLVDVLADMSLAGPGVACLRALSRVLGSRSRAEDDVREAAARAAWGIRVLLNHPESITLIRAKRQGAYWRRALSYCVEGGLQSVLDEFAHVALDLQAVGRLEPERRAAAIANLIRSVTSTRTTRIVPEEITVTGHKAHFEPHSMRTRFARAYGEDTDEETGAQTSAEIVRDAFNSPFAPFVLASTSVGQEGLDFHPYCHAVVHWNLPSNPVDLEQREGRVHRYKGHALRKNVAAALGGRSLLRDDDDPWLALFKEAEKSDAALGDKDIVPYWVFPGDSKIERHIPALPLSRDEERLHRLQRSLALYRSVLGQPRQEELVELLAERELPGGLTTDDLRIDLSPRKTKRSSLPS